MAWSQYEPPMHSQLSDDEFDAQYFPLISDIWEAFQNGEIGRAKREEYLKSFRDRMESIRVARSREALQDAIAAAKGEGLAFRRAVGLS